ncbi:MAG TPA: MFS transporter [Candidatus Paceibacterota bacterium]|nr:MFS transporter [Candidatus Paceibacterota bacterium]HMP19100.1 MFS transporter [Candidatus Paceibacterota bacterium]HMP85104.1 MFS transporter [Candidatus Paceibacterota bacterium]
MPSGQTEPVFIKQNLNLASSISKNKRIILYITSFLIALHNTPAVFINSSMVEQFVGDKYVGYIFAISSLLSLILLSKIKNFLNKIGNYKTFATALVVNFICLSITSLSLFVEHHYYGPIFVSAYIIGHMARIAMIFCMDVFLENASQDKDTGGIRGILLTSINLSFIIGPLLASSMITSTKDAGVVYIWGLTLLIPIYLIIKRNFSNYIDSNYTKNDISEMVFKIFRNKDIYNVCRTNFTLAFFYSWMIIYTPIYLRTIFALSEVAMIIGFGLLPFILLQIPLGKIADKILGEKEIMTAGFIIAGISTSLISFINSDSMLVWIAIIFMTRVGASMIEVMNETYLFKKVNDSDIDILSAYRSIEGLAYIGGPILASLLLIFIDIKFIFLVLAIIVIHGIKFSLRITDTK